MSCYECAREGAQQPAVVVCKHCGAGMCLTHLAVERDRAGAGGTRLDCGHDTWAEEPS